MLDAQGVYVTILAHSSGVIASFSAKYAYDYLHYLADPNKDESLMYINNRYRQQELYVSTANCFDLTPYWSLNLSADWQFNLQQKVQCSAVDRQSLLSLHSAG